MNFLPDQLANLPAESWQLAKSDVIIVLGTPANKFGKAGPILRERVLKGIELLNQGYGKYIIFTGAAAHNKFIEAEVMADLAREKGVSDDKIVLEPRAQNTYQNAFNSVEIMRQHGWKSAVVVSSPAHLRRADYIFSHYPITCCMAGSADPKEQSLYERVRFDQREKFHLLTAIMSGQPSTFGLTPEQAVEFKNLEAAK